MELRQLEYFVAVAEEANFTRAAARVHISQSGVSAQIRALERELGAELIDRSGGTATLTTAGQAALTQARATLAAAGSVRQSVDDVAGLLRGSVRVGMVTACTVPQLFDALARFHSEHPGVELTLQEGNSDRLVADVRSGELDLALVGVAARAPDGLESMVVIDEKIAAAVSPEHPLASQKRATLAQVNGYPIVSLPVGTGVRTVFDRDCEGVGITPSIALQASAPDAVADLAARGVGVAILSASMIDTHRGRLTAVELTDSTTSALLALVWTQNPSDIGVDGHECLRIRLTLTDTPHKCRSARLSGLPTPAQNAGANLRSGHEDTHLSAASALRPRRRPPE